MKRVFIYLASSIFGLLVLVSFLGLPHQGGGYDFAVDHHGADDCCAIREMVSEVAPLLITGRIWTKINCVIKGVGTV